MQRPERYEQDEESQRVATSRVSAQAGLAAARDGQRHEADPMHRLSKVASAAGFRDWLGKRGWRFAPLELRSLPDPGVVRDLVGGADAIWWLNPPEAVSLWQVVSSGSLDAASLRAAVRRIAGSSDVRAALVIAQREGTTEYGLFASDDGGETVYSWSGSIGRVPAEVLGAFRALSSPASPEVLLARVIVALRRRETTARFFSLFREHRDAVADAWKGLGEATEAERRHLALVLLCRLLFVSFIDGKGWLGPAGAFVPRLLLAKGRRRLYADCLVPLFFDALNKPVSERDAPDRFPEVPFLNGGLFEPTPIERSHPDHGLPDDVLRALTRDLFSGFRFVSDEQGRDPIGVDPAMLGTVFERLMDSGARARTGAFYTPPDLVRLCVDEVLTAWAERNVAPELVEYLAGGGRVEPDAAQRGLRRLRRLRVLDPAVGSGAFLLGTLERLAAWEERLADAAGEAVDAAVIRRRIVADALHGVDVSRTAVTLCELRLWLAIAAAMRDGAGTEIAPLPNISHRVRHGDALWSASAFAWTERVEPPSELIETQRDLLRSYGQATGTHKAQLAASIRETERAVAQALLEARRDDLRARVDAARRRRQDTDLFGERVVDQDDTAEEIGRLEEALRDVEDALHEGGDTRALSFEPRVHFAEALADGGFDVVVGNPPWVRLSDLPAATRRRLRATYRWMRGRGQAFGAQPDLSVAFVERSLALARPGGVVGLLAPAKLFRARYGATLRRGLLRDATPIVVRDLTGDALANFGADVFPAFICASPQDPQDRSTSAPVRVARSGAGERVVPSTLLGATEAAGDVWPLWDGPTMELLRRLLSEVSLAERWAPRMGVKTGANRVFIDPPDDLQHVVDLVRGADIRALRCRPMSRLFFAHDLVTGEVVDTLGDRARDWIVRHESRLADRSDARASTAPWELFRVRPAALGPKVIWRDIGRTLEAAYTPAVVDGGPVPLNTVYYVGVPDEVVGRRLAAWLCAAPARFVAASFAEPALNGFARYTASNVARVPVPDALLDERSRLTRAFDREASVLRRDPTDRFRWATLDALAARLIGLKGSEFAMLRRALAELSGGDR